LVLAGAWQRKKHAETPALFELIAGRAKHRHIAITAQALFSDRNQALPDRTMTVAAIDRLVHHAAIRQMNVDSDRRRAALPDCQ
jgi:DNA replication protein DnaC